MLNRDQGLIYAGAPLENHHKAPLSLTQAMGRFCPCWSHHQLVSFTREEGARQKSFSPEMSFPLACLQGCVLCLRDLLPALWSRPNGYSRCFPARFNRGMQEERLGTQTAQLVFRGPVLRGETGRSRYYCQTPASLDSQLFRKGFRPATAPLQRGEALPKRWYCSVEAGDGWTQVEQFLPCGQKLHKSRMM